VLKILRKHGLADGQSVCIDATTLQANASMKSLVRRDTGQAYEDYDCYSGPGFASLRSIGGQECPESQRNVN
jgi:hypothetical protein